MIIGLVGKPSAGKSTFFKAATLMNVERANYPFTTIKPNSGTGFTKVECADKFFNVQCNPRMGYCRNNKRFVPIEIIDVAGLVPGAHEGKGMGLSFLDDLNQADALIHVIDASGSINEKGEPVGTGTYDPANDIEFLEKELDYWYLGILKKTWEKFARTTVQTQVEVEKALHKQFSGLGSTEDMIKEILLELKLYEKRINTWNEEELHKFARELRIKTKPMLIAANKIDMPKAKENYEKLQEKYPHLVIVPCSAESELALKEADKHKMIRYIPGDDDYEITGNLTEAQQKGLELIKEKVIGSIGSTGVQNVIDKAVKELLHLMPIFPGGVNNLVDKDGNTLPDCFLLEEGSTALQFAYKIHTDLGDKFIRAIDVKTKRTVGKEHKLQSGDVVEIVANR